MMEDVKNLKDYTFGFNQGYLIEKENPEKAKELFKNVKAHSDQVKGMIAGRKERQKELFKEQLKKKSKERDNERER